jgi:ABC-type multidrug transport system ATPase subunit
MKQRVKLALAFFSKTEILCLDEPTSNLDKEGLTLYHYLVKNHLHYRTVIVSSNDLQEYDFCSQQLLLQDYKS